MQKYHLTEALQQLVSIPSVNPEFANGDNSICGEQQLAFFLTQAFKTCGASSVIADAIDEGSSRENVYAFFGGNSDKTICWDIHMDTVGVSGMNSPFTPMIKNDCIYGRGAVDTKASFAIALDLLSRGEKPKHNLLIAATCSEEYGGQGAKAFARWASTEASIDQLIVAEPTECIPSFAQKGAIWLQAEFQGKRGHSAFPESALNPVDSLARTVVALGQHRVELAKNVRFGDTPTLEVTSVNAGLDTNSIPAVAKLVLDRRLVPGETPDEVLEELSRLILSSSQVEVQLETLLAVSPLVLARPSESPLLDQFTTLTGCEPSMTKLGTNAGLYGEMPAKEAIIFGPGSIAQAHQVEEFVSIEQLKKARAIMAEVVGISI